MLDELTGDGSGADGELVSDAIREVRPCSRGRGRGPPAMLAGEMREDDGSGDEEHRERQRDEPAAYALLPARRFSSRSAE